jgi:hypothetical protein
MNQCILLFLMFQHNKKRMLHEIMRQEFLRKNHQNFCNLRHNWLLWLNLFYQEHSIKLDKRLHNKKIEYQLIPIYLRKKNHPFVVIELTY